MVAVVVFILVLSFVFVRIIEDHFVTQRPTEANLAAKVAVLEEQMRLMQVLIGGGIQQGIQVARLDASGTRASDGFGDLSSGGVGPAVTVNVGPSLRVLVLLSCFMNPTEEASVDVSDLGEGRMGYEVTGASNISPDPDRALVGQIDQFNKGDASAAALGLAATFVDLVDASDGLLEGLNTFTAKYDGVNGASPSTEFAERRIVVIPF